MDDSRDTRRHTQLMYSTMVLTVTQGFSFKTSFNSLEFISISFTYTCPCNNNPNLIIPISILCVKQLVQQYSRHDDDYASYDLTRYNGINTTT